jgi:predicted DNA-binding transcriptional regulator YafY
MLATRFYRCLQLLHILQSRIGYSVEELAEEFSVTPRTIYRDLCLLADAGIPVSYDPQKHGRSLQSHLDVGVVGLLPEELVALLLSAHIFSLSCIPEVRRPLRQAISKLLVRVPMALRNDITRLLSSIGGRPSPRLWPEGSQSAIAEILAALRENRAVRVVFCPPDKPASCLQTKISGHRLVAAGGHWYLVGRSSWHRKVFRFDLQHIRHAEQAEEPSPSMSNDTGGGDGHGQRVLNSASR